MKPRKEARTNKSTDIIVSAYRQREKNFTTALEKVLLALAEDQISRQMLQDETSEKYIARRVQEVFKQIIVDDREKFIEQILSKLQMFESMHKSEQEEIIKYLGEEFLIRRSMPSVGPMQRISHVHILIDAIKDLNATIDQLESKNTKYSERLRTLGNKGRVEYNADSPYFMHVFYEVDLTEFSNVVKDIVTKNESVRHSVKSLFKKTTKIIALMKQKSLSAVALYNKKMNKLEVRLKREKSNSLKMKETFNNEMQQMKEELTEAKEKVRNMDIKNEQLQNSITSRTSDAKDLKAKHFKLENELNTARKQNKELTEKNNEYETKIFSLQLEQTKNEQQIKKLTAQNQTLSEELENQKEEQKDNQDLLLRNQNNNKQIRKELEMQKQKAQDLEIDNEGKDQTIESLKQKISKLIQENKELQGKYSETQEEVQELSSKNQSLQNRISELTTKYEKAQVEADDARLNNESNLAQVAQEMRALKKQIAKQEDESKKKTELIEQQKEQIENFTEENENMHKQILAYKSDIKEKLAPAAKKLQEENESLSNQIEEGKERERNIQDAANELKNKIVDQQEKIASLEEEIEIKNGKIDENQAIIDKLKQTKLQSKDDISKLETENLSLTQKVNELNNQLRIATAQNQRLTVKCDELQNALDISERTVSSVKGVNTTQQNSLSELLDALQTSSVPLAIKEINKGKEAIANERAIKEILSVSNKPDAVSRAKDVLHMLAALQKATGETDPEKVNDKREDYEMALSLLGIGENLHEAIQKMMNNQDEASAFVTEMISTITGTRIPSKSVFPMNPNKKEQILSVLKKASDEAKADRATVSNIVQQANSIGYSGKDGNEAASFIKDFYTEKEKQKILDEMNKQLTELREALDAERESHKKDIEKKIKEVAESRNATIQLSQKFKLEREELWNNNSQLEARIRQLTDELNNEKSLRKELSRVGAGMSADKKLLKSKLSAQEFKLLELVEKLVQSENKTRQLHETTKRARQEILGKINH